ncbi:hypothetical protein P885DRAFT_62923 [Corynascus similis CBS 632.67]
MTQDTEKKVKPRYWLLTSPRTASNMLVKILNLDEQNVRPAPMGGGYFFLEAALQRFEHHKKPMGAWTPEEREAVIQAQQAAFDALQDHLAAAEQEGQGVYVKEHAAMMTDVFFESKYTYGDDAVSGEPGTLTARGVDQPTRSPLNLTSLPDEFLRTWHPTFLIRHPAMTVPSLYRTTLADFGLDSDITRTRKKEGPLKVETTMRWFRFLYEFYRAHFPKDSLWPIVLDADDIMRTPQLVAKYAPLAGLDPTRLRFEWDRVPEERFRAMPKSMQVMTGTISSSSRIDPSKVAGDVDIDTEAAKWRAEFGEEAGRKIEGWVRDMMPDYLALHSQRMRLD